MRKINASERVRAKLHLKLKWDGQERDEVRRYNRERLNDWKKEKGYAPNLPAENIPEFLESLERIRLYGYSYTDIGVMWGLSGEAVRKHFRNYNLKRGRSPRGAMYMVWDKEKSYFVPVSVTRRAKILLVEKAERRERKREERKEIIEEEIRKFKKTNGIEPTTPELSDLVGLSHITIARVGGYIPRQINYTEALDNLYISSGVRGRRGRGRTSKGVHPMRELNLDSKF